MGDKHILATSGGMEADNIPEVEHVWMVRVDHTSFPILASVNEGIHHWQLVVVGVTVHKN